MYAEARLIARLSNLPTYGTYSGLLVNVHGTILWHCEHAHSFESTARDCAEYERQKRLAGR